MSTNGLDFNISLILLDISLISSVLNIDIPHYFPAV
jgi:hypothetical protein